MSRDFTRQCRSTAAAPTTWPRTSSRMSASPSKRVITESVTVFPSRSVHVRQWPGPTISGTNSVRPPSHRSSFADCFPHRPCPQRLLAAASTFALRFGLCRQAARDTTHAMSTRLGGRLGSVIRGPFPREGPGAPVRGNAAQLLPDLHRPSAAGAFSAPLAIVGSHRGVHTATFSRHAAVTSARVATRHRIGSAARAPR
jgi:hypothetical protein